MSIILYFTLLPSYFLLKLTISGTTLAVLNKDLITTVYCGVGMNIVMVLTTGEKKI